MNKYLCGIIGLCVLPVSAFAANDLAGFDDRVPLSEKLLRQYKTETPNVVYRDHEKKEVAREGKWYMGLNGDLSFLTWENKYSGTESGSDKFNFKTMFGLDLSVGYRFDKKWRVDGTIGYVGKYSEKETEYYGLAEKTEFDLESYFVMANAYYDITHGFYAGLGAGLAITKIDVDNTVANNVSKTTVSPMGAATLGWTYMLDEKVDFDAHYRLSMFDAGSLNIGGVNVDSGLVIGNTVSVGVRYHF